MFNYNRKFEEDVTETITIEADKPETQEAEVTVTAPEFVVTISDLTVKEGEGATLTCKVKGQPTPEITWYHADQPITTDDVFRVLPGSEEGESILEIPEIFPEDGGLYTVKAMNQAGTIEATATLNVTGEIVLM